MNQLENIQLNRNSTFLDLEKLGGRILDVDRPIKFQIPHSLSYSGGFGVEAAALQILATVLRKDEDYVLHTAVKHADAGDEFEDLCNQFFGLCCLRLAGKIVNQSLKEVAMRTALVPAFKIFGRLREGDYLSAFKGMYLAIPSIKAPVPGGGKDREFENPLYVHERVIGSDGFMEITTRAIKAVMPNIRVSQEKKKILQHISEITRELYTNTHRHARSDYKGDPYRKNFRAIIYKVVELSEERIQELSSIGGGELSLFVASWLDSAKGRTRFIDISVVDSGPGLGRRWLRRERNEIEEEEEANAVLECFTKHRSSDVTDSSGSGLNNVLADLARLEGWMKLRSGRVLLEKSFFRGKGDTVIKREDLRIKDRFFEGTMFNILIPVEKLQEL